MPPKRRPGRGAHPPVLKRFGQHFLDDPRILARIVDALAPAPGETVIEIGPGRGALTAQLIARAGRVIAIEIDRALAAALQERYAGDERLLVVQGDVLEQPLGALAGGPYALIGNVPYNITTPILFHALCAPRPSRAVLLVQREVAERMAASPGSKIYGALSVTLQAVAHVELLFQVPAGAFRPPPKVESALVRVTPREAPVVPVGLEARYRGLVRGAFAQRRKQMRRVVRSLAPLDAAGSDQLLAAAGIAPDARPEVLTPTDFVRLLTAILALPPASPVLPTPPTPPTPPTLTRGS